MISSGSRNSVGLSWLGNSGCLNRGGNGGRHGIGGLGRHPSAFDLGSCSLRDGGGRSSADTVLVDLDGVDLPVRLLESRGILSDVVDTALHGAAGIAHGAGGFGKNITGPVAAKGCVNDQLLCLEALCKVA